MKVDRARLQASISATEQRLKDDAAAGHVYPSVQTTLVSDVHAVSAFEQYGKRFTFACDESFDRGGGATAPSPLRYFLSGIAFCLQVWYAKGAAITGCDIEHQEIGITTYLDMRGEHRIDDRPPHPQWIIVDAAITSPAPPDSVLAMVDEANRRCPVSTLVGKAVPIYERITHNGARIRDTVPPGLGGTA